MKIYELGLFNEYNPEHVTYMFYRTKKLAKKHFKIAKKNEYVNCIIFTKLEIKKSELKKKDMIINLLNRNVFSEKREMLKWWERKGDCTIKGDEK